MKLVTEKLPDIKPQSHIRKVMRHIETLGDKQFDAKEVGQLVGMSSSFVNKVVGRKKLLTVEDVYELLDQDAFTETFVPRSKILDYLSRTPISSIQKSQMHSEHGAELLLGDAVNIIPRIDDNSINCVVTSTPYWGMRIYDKSAETNWADGEVCPFGHEQTPESFVRHSVEVLKLLKPKLTPDGSIWWNVMDTFNTRTQIRKNASEALNAMKGNEKKKWNEHECRRYSAGHAYLKDGEQCLIPAMIAKRASGLGYYVKSVITWAKTATTPEPQNSRVSRNLEYIIHLSKQRTPKFDKKAFRELPPSLGGRHKETESDKLTDVWSLSTSSGRDGHGAQFPVSLPARCIALSTTEGDVILDPFVGSGNSAVAAKLLKRNFIGIDINDEYLETTKMRLAN